MGHHYRHRVDADLMINAGVGVFFCLAFFVVFIPQHIECWSRQNCTGLSPWLLLFGGVSFVFAFYNVLLMDIGTLGACSGADGYDPEAFNCIAAFSPILQQALPAITGYPSWYYWYHIYCPKVLWTQHLYSLSLFLFFTLLGGGISLYVLLFSEEETRLFVGTSYGIIATLTNFIMWLPQIETTMRLRSRGALSVPMLISTVIADILFSMYLYLMAHQHWSVWLPQVPDAIQQIVLLCLLWHYDDIGVGKPNPIYTPMLSSSASTTLLVKFSNGDEEMHKPINRPAKPKTIF